MSARSIEKRARFESLRTEIDGVLRKFHSNAHYPEATEDETTSAINAILGAVCDWIESR